MLLHVAELHECGGWREQPEAMWGMRGKPQKQGSLGFMDTLGRRQSPETQKGGWQGEGVSKTKDLETRGKILTRFRAILTFASSRAWHIVGVQLGFDE